MLDHSRVSPSYSHAPYRDGTAVCLAAYGWLSTRATPLTNHMSMWARPLLLFYPISISSYWLNGLQSMLFPSTTRLARGACRTAGSEQMEMMEPGSRDRGAIRPRSDGTRTTLW